ncbi:MAG: malate:quinone oxidoreductase, partial [Bacteroidia bacterium]|nr:malate:quinone oxidoreductase [Bacteroidia bacterium]
MSRPKKEVVLIGAGIMSATLGVLIKALMPDMRIKIFERLDRIGAESSDAWNNAGTGHSAFCELNYTPEYEDGTIDLSKALRIAGQFEISKQLWTYLKEKGHLPQSEAFINDIPHMSFVWGAENVSFLKKRHQQMTQYSIFKDMMYSSDLGQIAEWVPLMMKGRKSKYPFSATRMELGTDVNFGAITRGMIKYLEGCDNVDLNLGYEVRGLHKLGKGEWQVDVKNLDNGDETCFTSDYIFIGAGGGAI